MKTTSFLLVDDNAVALKELRDSLKYMGYKHVEDTSRADDAWKMLRFNHYDCVIAEMEMPDMSGLALLKIVRSDDRFYNIPFFLTNSAFTKVKVLMAGREGVTGLIVKPYDLANFREKIKALGAVTEEPEIAETRHTLEEGLKMLDGNNYEAALDVFERLTREGETAEVYYNIGYIKTAQGKYGEAIAAFRKATQLDRLFAKAYEAMGRVYQKLGRKQDAEKSLQKAADIYMTKEKVQDAEQILNEILEISPDTINVYNSLGVLYRKKGEFETALVQYKKALKIHSDQPHIYYNIGRLYLELNDPGEAKSYFSKALDVDPKFKEAQEILNAIELGTF